MKGRENPEILSESLARFAVREPEWRCGGLWRPLQHYFSDLASRVPVGQTRELHAAVIF